MNKLLSRLVNFSSLHNKPCDKLVTCGGCAVKADIKVNGDEQVGYWFETKDIKALGWEFRDRMNTPWEPHEIESTINNQWFCPICKIIN